MAVTFVASTNATFATAASIAQNTPAGILDDDGVFAFVMSRDTVTPPAGWTQLVNQSCTDGGTTQYLIAYRKDTVVVADSSTSFTFTNGSSTRMGLCYTVVRATSLSVAQSTSGTATVIDFIVNQAVATATRTNELFLYAATTISQTAAEQALIPPAGSTLTSGTSSTENRLGTAYEARQVGEEADGAWDMNPGGSTAFYNGLATITIRLVELVDAETVTETPTFETYALYGDQDTRTLTDAVNFWAASNFKEYVGTYSDTFHGRGLSFSSLSRASSSTSSATATVKYFGSISRKTLWLLFVSSRYAVATPAGFTNRVNIAASGSNGQRYFKVMELTDKTLWKYNDDVTVNQGFEAPIAVALCLWTANNDGYPVFVAATNNIASNTTTDIATPPAITVTRGEREHVITAMCADPHPSIGSGHSTNGSVAIRIPSASSPSAPTSESFNLVIADTLYGYRVGQVTSGTLGYASTPTTTTDVAVLSATLRYFVEQSMIEEFPRSAPSASDVMTYTKTQAETVATTDPIIWNWAQLVTETSAVTGAATFVLGKYATATAVAQFLDPTSVFARYSPTVTEAPRARDALRAGWLRVLSETINLPGTAVVTAATRVLESLRLLDVVLPPTKYVRTVTEAVRAWDLLARFAAGEVIEGLGVTASLARTGRYAPAIAEALGLEATAARTLVVRVVSAERLNLSDDRVLNLLLRPTISENVEITLAYVAPGDSLTTWAVNARTGAVTEYMNYGFNSFAEMGRLHLGATSAGLYELVGDDDAGDDVLATLKTGYGSFGDGRPTAFKAAYIGVRGGGPYYFKIDAADGREFVYQITARDMQTTKINLGKGLRARYFAFELVSTGQDFDLESIEFVPLLSQRHK